MSKAAPSTFVVDDDPSVRRALRRLLKSAGFDAQAFASGEEFLRHPVPEGPACVVLDVTMPGLGGLALQRTLSERNTGLPVVFITGHGDIPMAVRALKSGAVDFLPKPFDDQDLLNAVRRALAQAASARQEAADTAAIRQRADALSPREREVLALVVRGMLNKQIGRQLGIAEKTVKVHRAQVMHKMEAVSVAELVQMAARIGISPGSA